VDFDEASDRREMVCLGQQEYRQALHRIVVASHDGSWVVDDVVAVAAVRR
jgi:hypothetical protein